MLRTLKMANSITFIFIFQYREYRLKQGRDGALMNIELCDTMGMTHGNDGISTKDISTVLDGNFMDRTLVSLRYLLSLKIKTI